MALISYISERKISVLTLFLITAFFLFVADSSLSYLFPIVVEEKLGSNFLMGLVIGFSSIVGMICDLVFPQLCKGRTWKFYLFWGGLLSFFFPVSTTVAANLNSVLLFLIASGIWGIYFEFIIFSIQKFIVSTQSKDTYLKDWGLMHTFIGTAKIVGPVMGAVFISISFSNSSLFVIFIQLIAFLFLMVCMFAIKTRKFHHSYENDHYIRKVDFIQELKYWGVIFPSIIPLFSSSLIIVSIDATFWILGGLLGKQLFEGIGNASWVPIVLFVVMNIVGSALLSRFKITQGKKRLTYLSLIISGLFLSLIALSDNLIFILTVIIISSFALAFAGVFNDAVFSDLISRLGKKDIHLIAVSRLTASISYAVGPIILGLLADNLGYLNTFSIVGVATFIGGILLLIFTPKKLKLHEKSLKAIES